MRQHQLEKHMAACTRVPCPFIDFGKFISLGMRPYQCTCTTVACHEMVPGLIPRLMVNYLIPRPMVNDLIPRPMMPGLIPGLTAVDVAIHVE